MLDGSGLPSCCPTGLRITSAGNVVRGLVIQHFHTGIDVLDANDNRLEGNFIGTNASGTAAASNRCSGVRISREGTSGSAGNVVGGDNPAARNLIAGNLCVGVEIGAADRNRVQGNVIGGAATGAAAIGNTRDGVYIFGSARDNTVGGSGEHEANLIVHNGGHGILVSGQTGPTTGNRLQRNRISQNGGRGIALEAGGNRSLAAPTISQVTLSSVSGIACPGCTVEVFADAAAQARFCEGTTTSDANGQWRLTIGGTWRSVYLTASAADSQGNTSELSAPFAVQGPPMATASPGPTGPPTGTAGVSPTPAAGLRVLLPIVRKEAP